MKDALVYSLSRTELAQAYGVSRTTFYYWLRNVKTDDFTHNRKFLPAEIDKILENYGKPPNLERVINEKLEKNLKKPLKTLIYFKNCSKLSKIVQNCSKLSNYFKEKTI